MKAFLIVAGFACLLTPALADCDEEAKRAYSRIITSGPYRFDTTGWRNGRNGHVSGQVIPRNRMLLYIGADKKEYLEYNPEDTSKSYNLTSDEFGWTGPGRWVWFDDSADIGEGVDRISAYGCLGSVREGERNLNVFWRKVELYLRPREDTLFVDSDTGLPVRRESIRFARPDLRTVTWYSFDPSISIARPIIDPKARWQASINAYNHNVQLSEATCRQEVIRILEQGYSSLPFRYRISLPERFAAANGITGFSGIFAPPNSLYQKWEGYPGHGAGSEIISVGGAHWWKSDFMGLGWKKAEKGVFGVSGTLPEDWNAPILFSLGLDKECSLKHIGYASCSSETKRDNQTYLSYEYNVFKDSDGAWKMYAHRIMLIDSVSHLPARFEDQLDNNEFTAQETRQYDRSLRVDIPE